MSLVEPLFDVTAVEVRGDHVLRLTFEDGRSGMSVSKAANWRGILKPLADPADFAQVEVDPEAGTIVWPNRLDLAPEPLYAEAREHRSAPSRS